MVMGIEISSLKRILNSQHEHKGGSFLAYASVGSWSLMEILMMHRLKEI